MDFIKTPIDEAKMLYYWMQDASNQLKATNKIDKRLFHAKWHRVYKRALWHTMSTHKLTINTVVARS